MRRLISSGLCFTLSLVLILGSVFSSCFTLPNNAFAVDMGDTMEGGGGVKDGNQGGDSGDEDDEDDHNDGSNGMPPPKEAPSTTGALTAGGNSDDDDDSEGDEDNEPVTTDTLTAKRIECPAGQEYQLFSGCQPIGGAENPGNIDMQQQRQPQQLAQPVPTDQSSKLPGFPVDSSGIPIDLNLPLPTPEVASGLKLHCLYPTTPTNVLYLWVKNLSS